MPLPLGHKASPLRNQIKPWKVLFLSWQGTTLVYFDNNFDSKIAERAWVLMYDHRICEPETVTARPELISPHITGNLEIIMPILPEGQWVGTLQNKTFEVEAQAFLRQGHGDRLKMLATVPLQLNTDMFLWVTWDLQHLQCMDASIVCHKYPEMSFRL